jgi:serine/threonine protein kinase
VILYAMLYGELPFDEENVNTTFKYIRDAKYYMKGTTSIEGKDLLNRMLQPNPFNRITISEILDHPWFKKETVYTYLIHPFVNFNASGCHKQVDDTIVQQLYDLQLNLEIKDDTNIKNSILKGEMHDFCIAYEYLYHSKLLSEIRDGSNLKIRSFHFNRKLLTKPIIKSINRIHKKLTNLDKELMADDIDDVKTDPQIVSNVSRSFHTNSSSTEYLKDKTSFDELKRPIGLVYKSTIDNLFKHVFSVLKEQNIIWKPWNSHYVYKCQSGIPLDKIDLAGDKDKLEEYMETNQLKFFIHFNSTPRRREAFELDTTTKHELEHLV